MEMEPVPLCTVFLLLQSLVFEGLCFSVKEKALVGYELGEEFETDWLGCLQSCHELGECVSYNFHVRENTCQLNHAGIENACQAEQLLNTRKMVVFHQIKPAVKLATRQIQKCPCTTGCGVDDQCGSKQTPGIGDTRDQPAASCQDILQRRSDARSGPYYLQTAFRGTSYIYCEMSALPGCGGGGWTLVIKMDGNKSTLRYNSTLWSGMKPYNEIDGADLNEKETFLPSYWSLRFTKLCIGMKYGGVNKWIALNHTADTLLSVILPGVPIYTHLDVAEWKSLLPNSSLQIGCTRQGFNINNTASARIGIIGLPRGCSSITSQSRLGLGTAGSFYGMDDTNSCGNEARNKPDNGERSVKAFGYVFIQ